MLRFHTCLEHFAACQISTCTWLCNQNIQPEKLITQGLQSLGLHRWAVKVEVQNLLWWALKINQGKAAWWVFPALQGKLVTDWEQTGSTAAADNTNKLYSLIEKGKKKKIHILWTKTISTYLNQLEPSFPSVWKGWIQQKQQCSHCQGDLKGWFQNTDI